MTKETEIKETIMKEIDINSASGFDFITGKVLQE